MKKRILVRTNKNVSYVGTETDTSKFGCRGNAIIPNPKLKMQIFIPEEEVLEIICDGKFYSFHDYLNLTLQKGGV